MIGNIVNIRYNGNSSSGEEPGFDKTTRTFTTKGFIDFLNTQVYSSSIIGAKVVINNTEYGGDETYIIAAVNRSTNNTYDLIAEHLIIAGQYGGYWDNNYRNSYARSWLNSSFYNGFDEEFKSRIIKISYNSNGTIYSDDYAVIPSSQEVGGSGGEGSVYSIFTNNASRIKYKLNGSGGMWWTRTAGPDSNYTMIVSSDGNISYDSQGSRGRYFIPLFRVT